MLRVIFYDRWFELERADVPERRPGEVAQRSVRVLMLLVLMGAECALAGSGFEVVVFVAVSFERA